jgi:hypothetical protein
MLVMVTDDDDDERERERGTKCLTSSTNHVTLDNHICLRHFLFNRPPRFAASDKAHARTSM